MSASRLTLMYHNVTRSGETFDGIGTSVTRYFVTEEQFAHHLDSLAAHAANTPNAVTTRITFDDGWAGSFDAAGPLLERFGMTGTVFVTTGLIGQPHFADADTIRQAVAGGRFNVGSHGVTHRLIGELSDDEIRRELADSKQTLEEIIGQPVTTIAFPGGSYDRRVVQIARELGYSELHTSKVGLNRPTDDVIRRSAILSTTTASDVAAWARGEFGGTLRKQHVLDVAKTLLGRRLYATLRGRLLGSSNDLDMTDLLPQP